jgi:phosphotransferase system IIA component
VALIVAAPLAGSVRRLTDVPDPVFAAGLVGPGLAIDPLPVVPPDGIAPASGVPGPVVVVAPVGGQLAKLKPHAFVVIHESGRAVLVHLGIDTVTLGGAGFELLATEGEDVTAGAPVVRWDPGAVAARGLSPVCPVIALDAAADAVGDPATGPVTVGAALYTWL